MLTSSIVDLMSSTSKGKVDNNNNNINNNVNNKIIIIIN